MNKEELDLFEKSTLLDVLKENNTAEEVGKALSISPAELISSDVATLQQYLYALARYHTYLSALTNEKRAQKRFLDDIISAKVNTKAIELGLGSHMNFWDKKREVVAHSEEVYDLNKRSRKLDYEITSLEGLPESIRSTTMALHTIISFKK